MRKVELLHNRNFEAGYGPDPNPNHNPNLKLGGLFSKQCANSTYLALVDR